jgi:thioredoxin-dependent peroxiredoxin
MQVPKVTFKTRVRDEKVGGSNPYRWQDVTTEDIFANQRVVIFSLPGAFTPTCSTFQVPGYEANYDKIRSLGVDEIYVVSVNDAFVMRKWMLDQKIEKLKFIPDGNAEFTLGMNMLVDKSNLGFGVRSWRYSAVVNNLEVEKMFVEPGICHNAESDPYGETTPENMVNYLQTCRF